MNIKYLKKYIKKNLNINKIFEIQVIYFGYKKLN